MTVAALPRWDLSEIYPALDSDAFEADFRAYLADLDAFEQTLDAHGVRAREAVDVDEAAVAAFEAALTAYNALLERQRTLHSYVASFTTTDSRDAAAQAKFSELQQAGARLTLLGTRWTAWLGALDPEALIERSPAAADHAHAVRRTHRLAGHLMSPPEEALAAELGLTGAAAWAKLHGTFTSQLSVTLTLDGAAQALPMSAVRNLAWDPDPAVRRAAHQAELNAWRANEVPLAAALNGVKGEVGALARRRGWADPLEPALFANAIDRATLEAMLDAARAAFPDFRRYLRAKAKALGQDRLSWCDLFAPLGQGRAWGYGEAKAFILEQFGGYSQKLQGLARRAFEERWIDAEPRAGKRDGAFCMGVRAGESRILSNFKPSYGGVSTLAHELGHAYHNLCLGGRTPLQRVTPMALAETASIFCETICRRAALEQGGAQEQLAILEASLQGACQVVVDISSRFLFEQSVFERRRAREQSAREFCELMTEAQRQTYGDGLDEGAMHPYMWAVKPHYYSAERSFYNFPYMFGMLFGLGLYARYEQDPEGFKASYDALLGATGLADAAELARRFDIDIGRRAFWERSLDVVRADVDRFVGLVGA